MCGVGVAVQEADGDRFDAFSVSRNPAVVISPTLTPLRSVRALITTVVPCAMKPMSAALTPPFFSTLSTPCSKLGGVVSDLAVVMRAWPVSASVSKQTRSVNVPPTSVATRSVGVVIESLQSNR